MRRLLVWRTLTESLKAIIDPAHQLLKKLHAVLQVVYREGVIDQSIVEIRDGFLLESYLGLKLNTADFAILMGHDVVPLESLNQRALRIHLKFYYENTSGIEIFSKLGTSHTFPVFFVAAARSAISKTRKHARRP